MRIAITSTEKDELKELDARFGRCKYFAIYDTETKTYSFVDNNAGSAEQGAGIAAAQNVIDMRVDVLLTGHLGPKAKQVIETSNVITQFYEVGTVLEVVEKYINSNK